MNFQLLIESLSEGFQLQIGVRQTSVWRKPNTVKIFALMATLYAAILSIPT